MRCVCAGRPRWTGRHYCCWRSPQGIWARSFGCTSSGWLPLRWIWRWIPASPSCVNIYMISVLASDTVRRPNAAHTTTITPIIFLSFSGDCEARPRHRQAHLKATSPGLESSWQSTAWKALGTPHLTLFLRTLENVGVIKTLYFLISGSSPKVRSLPRQGSDAFHFPAHPFALSLLLQHNEQYVTPLLSASDLIWSDLIWSGWSHSV